MPDVISNRLLAYTVAVFAMIAFFVALGWHAIATVPVVAVATYALLDE